MTLTARLVALLGLVTFAMASCSGSHHDDKTSWRADSVHSSKHRGRR